MFEALKGALGVLMSERLVAMVRLTRGPDIDAA
jgi:hypothetical protein